MLNGLSWVTKVDPFGEFDYAFGTVNLARFVKLQIRGYQVIISKYITLMINGVIEIQYLSPFTGM